MLNGEREDDRAIAGVRVGLRVGFVVREEKLSNAAIIKAADRAGVSEPSHFEVEGFGESAVAEALPHGAPRRKNLGISKPSPTSGGGSSLPHVVQPSRSWRANSSRYGPP